MAGTGQNAVGTIRCDTDTYLQYVGMWVCIELMSIFNELVANVLRVNIRIGASQRGLDSKSWTPRMCPAFGEVQVNLARSARQTA